MFIKTPADAHELLQMTKEEGEWKEAWVGRLWEQAREEVVRRPSAADMPNAGVSGWSIPGFEQAFLQEASMSQHDSKQYMLHEEE